MADTFSDDKRSEIMKKVHSKGNKSTELKLIEVFREMNVVGWRRNYAVKGHPDFVFLGKKVAVFVDGCFWHGHDCRNTIPSDNAEYWNSKRIKNQIHDRQVTEQFEKRGWKVLRIWECELKKKNREMLVEKIRSVL